MRSFSGLSLSVAALAAVLGLSAVGCGKVNQLKGAKAYKAAKEQGSRAITHGLSEILPAGVHAGARQIADDIDLLPRRPRNRFGSAEPVP